MLYFLHMKIAIDIRAACHRKAGKGYYTLYIIKELLKIDKKNTYILYSDKPSEDFPNIKQIRGFSIFWHLNLLWHLIKDKPDVFFAPTSYIVPALAPKRLNTVITVHDLVAFLFSDTHNRKATAIERLTLASALKKAKYAICVSQNTIKDLHEKFDHAASRTRLVYCAAGDEFKILISRELENVKSKYKLPEKFILGVGTIEPRKNFVSLIKAFASVKDDFKDLHLVIIGTKGWGSEETYYMIEECRIKNRTTFLGYVEYQDLVKIYNLAKIFIFPSIYEGFGMPPLEAMKSGCPVICSNTSSLPEVVGEAAYMIDPHDEEQIINGIRAILGNQDLAEALKKKGLEQAEKFSWRKSAEQLLKILTSCKK